MMQIEWIDLRNQDNQGADVLAEGSLLLVKYRQELTPSHLKAQLPETSLETWYYCR